MYTPSSLLMQAWGGSEETPLQVIRELLYIPNHASAQDIHF